MQPVGSLEVQQLYFIAGTRVAAAGWPSLGLPQLPQQGSTHRLQTSNSVDVNGTMLDIEATFCYLKWVKCWAPMGPWQFAIAAKCCMAWERFRKLTAMCICPASTQLCSRVVKHWEQTHPTRSGSATPTTSWSAGFGAPKIMIKLPQLHISRNLVLIRTS